MPTTNGHRLQTSIPNAAANVNGIRDGGAAPGRVWNIAAVLPAPAFYGGEGVLVWTLKKQDGTTLASGNIPFSIRGENPLDRATVRGRVDAEITVVPNGLRSTVPLAQAAMDAIIQHDSGGNQFNWTNTQKTRPDGPGTVNFLVHNPNHSSDGRGVGLTQVTWTAMNAAARTGVTWNWHSNVHEGCALFAGEKMRSAVNWLNQPFDPMNPTLRLGDRARCAEDKSIGGEEVDVAQVVIPNFTIGGKTVGDEAGADMSPELATAIKFYNGRVGPKGGDAMRTDGEVILSSDTEEHPAVFWETNFLVQGNGRWKPAFMTAAPHDALHHKVNAYVRKVFEVWP